MRRGLASMLMGLSLILGSLGWAGIVLSHALLDPSNSSRLMSDLVDVDTVRTVLVNRVADGMERLPPDDEPVSRGEMHRAATVALSDPAARRALGRGLTDAYRLGLAGEEPDPTFHHFDVNEAARLALLAQRPALKGRILVNPLVRVRLPVEGLSWMAGLKSLVDRFAIVAIAAAIIGFALTFVVAAEPAAVLHRAAWWILATAAFWVLLGLACAALARIAAPSSYIVLTAAWEHLLYALRTPAVLMASFGVGMLSISYLVPAMNRRRGALLLARAQNRLRTASAKPGGHPAIDGPGTAAGPDEPGVDIPGDERPDSELATVGAPQPTDPMPTSESSGRSTGSELSRRLSAAWLEGHGYLDDARIAPFFGPSSVEG